MTRTIIAILAGLFAFAILEFIAVQVALVSWPAYALAAPTRAYTLEMLLARQAVGIFCAFMAGATAAWVSRDPQLTVFITGAVMLLIAVIWHILIWDQYPVWYHLFFFSYLMPLAMLGGWMVYLLRREL